MAKIIEYRVYKLSTLYRKSWHFASKFTSFDDLINFFKIRKLHSYTTNFNIYKVRCIDEDGVITPMFYKVILGNYQNTVKVTNLEYITTIYPFVKGFFNE